MHRTLSGLCLLALVVTPAAAQEHDLRVEYRYKAGDKIKVQERSETHAKYSIKSGENVLNTQDSIEGFEQRYDEEVQEVDAEGDITKSVRTYSYVKSLATDQTLDLTSKPIKVQMARGEDGTFGFTAVDAGAPVPEVLQEILDREAGQKENEEENEAGVKLIMPDKPVAVGATWPVAVENACKLFSLEREHVSDEGYEGKGALEDGGDMLRVVITFKLPVRNFNGLECAQPMAFDTVIRMKMPPGATSPDGEAAMEGTVKGVAQMPEEQGFPKGATLDLDMKVVNSKQVQRAQ